MIDEIPESDCWCKWRWRLQHHHCLSFRAWHHHDQEIHLILPENFDKRTHFKLISHNVKSCGDFVTTWEDEKVGFSVIELKLGSSVSEESVVGSSEIFWRTAWAWMASCEKLKPTWNFKYKSNTNKQVNDLKCMQITELVCKNKFFWDLFEECHFRI